VSFAAFLAYASAFPQDFGILLGMACWVAGSFLATLVHECGHALAALACGWRVIVFVAGPIGIQLPNRSFALVSRDARRDCGGWVVAVPRARIVSRRQRWAAILAAGPVASLCLSAAAWADSASLLHPSPLHVDTRQLALGLALQALRGGLFSFLPGGGKHPSDGEQLRAMVRSDNLYETTRPALWLTALLKWNVRLRDLPAWMIDAAAAAQLPDMPKYLDTIEIGRVLDSAPVDAARARQLIDAFRERYGSDEWLCGCDAYLAAMWEGDADRARAALWSGPASSELRPLTLAAEAAIAARSGDTLLARRCLVRMEDALKRQSPFRNPTFEDIGSQIEALLSSPAATAAAETAEASACARA
jgi:hypothetical protein